MKKTVKTLLAVLLGLCLTAGIAGSTAAWAQSPDTTAESGMTGEVPAGNLADFEEQTIAQAFSAVMACWYRDFSERDVYWPDFGWEATGWYAAWLHRVEGVDLLREEEMREFHRAIGMIFELDAPENWLGERSPIQLRDRDGNISYDFREYKLRLEELLGVELELSVIPGDGLTETLVITQHFGYRGQTKKQYQLAFEPNDDAGSLFPYRLSSVTMPKNAPQTDPALGCSWDFLLEQNRMENILSLYPSVRIYSGIVGKENSTWLFRHGEETVLLTDAFGDVSGLFRGCSFDLRESTDGNVRPRISSIRESAETDEEIEDFVIGYLGSPDVLEVDRIEGDLIWADALYAGSYRQKLAFDRGSLALREVLSLREDGEVMGDVIFDYRDTAPDCAYLDSWNRPLRTLRILWESYPQGLQELREEYVDVPDDWEYLPAEAQWGDYTAYTNDRYIGNYQYPGDDVEYLLFLTTVKG